MSSPTDLPANFFELLSECQGLAMTIRSAKSCSPDKRQCIKLSLTNAKDFLGSLRSQHKSVKNCSCKKLKNTSSHHSHQQVVDATLSRRGNEQEVHRSAILAILLIQISRYLQIEKKKRFQLPSTKEGNSPRTVPNREKKAIPRCSSKHKREIHQYRCHWTPCHLPCEPCNYESKQMELCLQLEIQPIISMV